jgi:hypothetical protein
MERDPGIELPLESQRLTSPIIFPEIMKRKFAPKFCGIFQQSLQNTCA